MGTWSYQYDNLNRLAGATANQTGNLDTHYCWAYDAFGNRTLQAGSSAAFTAGSPACTLSGTSSYNGTWAHYSTANNNRLANTNQAMSGVGYDAAGEVINDGVNQYLYDAEGRVCAVSSSQITGGTILTGYVYNAAGQRVSKGTITSWSCDPATSGYTAMNDYVLGLDGEQVTEMAANASKAMVWQHTNVYAAGALFATYDNNGLHFHLSDWQGTRRVQTDYAGVMEQTCSSLPFGDTLSCSNSVPFPTEQHFTGKERDTESGLDYFGARYYGSSMGRFLSPDWSSDPSPVPWADLTDPQSLNLYAYVGNNPLSVTDPFGHNWLTGFLDGVANATYRPLATAINHPIITGRAVGNAVAHPITTAQAIRNGVVTTSQQVMTGDPTAIGTAAGTVGMLFIPGIGEAGEAVEGAADLARVGEVAEESGSRVDMMNKSLASQEQMGQIAAGDGTPIAGAGTSTALRDSQRLAAQYGGDAGDWQKVASGNYNPGGSKGGGFETHAYQNSTTGQVVEMKTKFQ